MLKAEKKRRKFTMKKKAVSALLCAAMVAGMLAGCGKGSDSGTPSDTSKGDASNATESASSNLKDDGKVLNIYCWNEEFKSRITAHYPDYKEVDATHGKIGDVDVVWNITPSDDNAYQNNLDAALLNQQDAPADDKIDIFLVEAERHFLPIIVLGYRLICHQHEIFNDFGCHICFIWLNIDCFSCCIKNNLALRKIKVNGTPVMTAVS